MKVESKLDFETVYGELNEHLRLIYRMAVEFSECSDYLVKFHKIIVANDFKKFCDFYDFIKNENDFVEKLKSNKILRNKTVEMFR